MKIAVRVGKAAAVLALAMPAVALAQYSGTSHPDDAPILNTPEVQAAPVVPVPAMQAVQQPSLKPRPGIPLDAAPVVDPDAGIVTVPAGTVRRAEPMAPKEALDVDAGIVTRVPGPANQLPTGTLVKVRLAENISTVSTASGTNFTALLTAPVERDGRVLLPAGSTLSGMVTDIHGGKRISGPASVHLRAVAVTLPDGTRYLVHGQVIDTGLFKQVKVDREGTLIGRDGSGKGAASISLATGASAATGAMLGGWPGAIIGAGVGAGVSTVVWLRQDRQMELPAEAPITFALTQPLTIGELK